MRSWRPKRRVCRFRKRRVPTQAPNRNDPLAVLGNTIICGVNLAQMETVTSADQRFQQLEHKEPISAGKKTFDILEYERAGLEPGN